MGGIDFTQHAGGVAVHNAVVLPSTHAHHFVAHMEFRVFAVHHLANGAANHDLAKRLWHCVTFAVIHAATHIRIQTQIMVTHQDLVLREGRRFSGHQFEVAGRRFALGAVV